MLTNDEKVLAVGRLITDLAPGSIQDLQRKTEALRLLRSMMQVEPVQEPDYSTPVRQAAREIEKAIQGGYGICDILQRLYNHAQGGEPEAFQTAENDPSCNEEFQPIGLAAIMRSFSAFNQRIQDKQYIDDIEFFRNGGI